MERCFAARIKLYSSTHARDCIPYGSAARPVRQQRPATERIMFRSPHKSTSQVRLSTVVLQAVAAKAAIVAAVAALAAAAALHSAQGTRRASASGSLRLLAQPPSDAPALSPAHAATSRWARNHIDNLELCCGCQVLNWRATSSSPVRYGHGPVTKGNRAPVSVQEALSVRGAVVGAYKTRPSQ